MPVDPDRIVRFLEGEAEHPVRISEIGRALGIRPRERRELRAALRRLVERGAVYRIRGGRYAAPGRIRLVVGRLRTWRRGHGVIIPEDGGADLFVPPGNLANAMDGDLVAARLEGRGRNGREVGRITRVLERGRRTVVGRFHRGRGRGSPVAFVVPEDPALATDVLVTAAPEDVADGDVVVVGITDWGTEHHGPAGVVETVLGPVDAPGVDMLAIIHAYELPTAFSEEAEAEARAAAERGVAGSDLDGRTDFRDRLVFTIDPADARDHDDALSIVADADGGAEVGVHIADVSHYVRPGSALDREALERGTSVYLVDRAIPMLPEALSASLCSLVPEEDRLTLSVVIRFDPAGKPTRSRLVRSVIRSRHRLSYERVQAVLDGAASIDADTDRALLRLRDLSRGLRAARTARGGLDLDLPEPRILLDDDGLPVDVRRAERWDSHRLIEDFMLLANRRVGSMAVRRRLPFLYRVHEPPDPDRAEQLRELAANFGHRLPRRRLTPRDVQGFLAAMDGRPEASLLAVLTLRSMKQARYNESDLGHFGLAARNYAHFTSPIRRYPDLVVHRILAEGVLGRDRGGVPGEDALKVLARHCSARERVATSAERDSVAAKRVRFMAQHLGGEFAGTISEVRPRGLIVLLDDWFVEGMVHVSTMADDYYEFVEERFLLIGTRTGRQFRLGQQVRVQVARVDTEERRIDVVLPGLTASPGRRKGTRRRGRRRV
ncbi:MAG: ribonuclease R [Gemmatimonadota bacterium]